MLAWKSAWNTKSVRHSIWKRETGASFQHATTHRWSTIGEKHRLGYIFINQLTNSSTLRPLWCGACCTTHLLTHLHELILLPWSVRIPANFFWDISVRFLSWEWWDFWRRHDHFRSLPKKSEVFRRRPKSAEVCRSLVQIDPCCLSRSKWCIMLHVKSCRMTFKHRRAPVSFVNIRKNIFCRV